MVIAQRNSPVFLKHVTHSKIKLGYRYIFNIKVSSKQNIPGEEYISGYKKIKNNNSNFFNNYDDKNFSGVTSKNDKQEKLNFKNKALISEEIVERVNNLLN